MSDYYVLRGHDVERTTLLGWATMFEDGEARKVAADTVGESRVSTVFLGMDHQWGDGPPLLFETLIFDGPHADDMWRYSTWEQAEAGHKAIVAALSEGRDPSDAVSDGDSQA